MSAMDFQAELEYLRAKSPGLVVLTSHDGASVVVSPHHQGRVFTSAFAGAHQGNGWVNHALLGLDEWQPHMNPFGGEDRFWLGPEGGQFSVFFAPDDEQTFANWQTPACVDSEPFELVSQSDSSVSMRKVTDLTNTASTTLAMTIDREVRLVPDLGFALPDDVACVAFESVNKITNTGPRAWDESGGMPSIWTIGMFRHSDMTTVVVPYDPGGTGEIVNDDYFGKVPTDRLVVTPDFVAFKGDGKHRSKIGLNASRSRPALGSWDPARSHLTVVSFNKPAGAQRYVNSQWVNPQAEPFSGDVVNSYNDGPNESGSILGPFYELETSSPAAALAHGESITHVHRTMHFQGSRDAMQAVADRLLGVNLADVENAL